MNIKEFGKIVAQAFSILIRMILTLLTITGVVGMLIGSEDMQQFITWLWLTLISGVGLLTVVYIEKIIKEGVA